MTHKSTLQPSTIDQITQQVRAELRDELREELRAEFSTHLQQMRAEMMALVSQGARVDPNRQVPDVSSGHRAFRESAEDENPYTPPPEDQQLLLSSFMYEPEIHIDEDMMETLPLEDKRNWVESSPTKVFDIDPNTQQVIVVDPQAYIYDDEMIKKADAMRKSGLVEIYAKDDSFIFTMESTGVVKSSQLLLNAIEVLKQKLDAFHLSEDTVEADEKFGELGAHMLGG
ncbi:hypothetical protein ACSBR1_001942 [Camellia fascicularis]